MERIDIGADVIGEQGCHLTWTELRRISKQELDLAWNAIKKTSVNYKDLPVYYCSLLNLQGFVLYGLQEEERAEEIFLRILEMDYQNVCALGNLGVLYYRQSRIGNYRECIDKLQKILAKQDSLVRARAYTDRAHAIRHFQQDKRCFTYMAFIKKAVEIGTTVENPEKAEWLFDYGLALYRKDCQLLIGKAPETTSESGFQEAIKTFHHVTLLTSSFAGNRSLSWVFMGILLRGKKGREYKKSLPELTELHGLSADDCFSKALEIDPENPVVLRRIGSEMTKAGCYKKALDFLNKSLDLEKSWFGYRHRGLLYLELCKQTNEATNQEQWLAHLERAKTDIITALKFKKVHADFSDLGYIYFLLKDFPKALQNFSCAVRNSRDDHFDPSVTHRRWAMCLKAMGEPEGSEQQLLKEMEVKDQLRRQATTIEEAFCGHGVNCHGFECDLARFNYSSDERPGYMNILSEEQYPFGNISVLLPRREDQYKYDFFIAFSHIDHKWSVCFFRKLERVGGLRGCIRYRDYEFGNSIEDNITQSIRSSAKTLIIMTPDSLRDHWCRYEVQRAHMESLRRPRHCVIPVMLRLCKIPQELELLTHIKCYDGQLMEDDWYRLRKNISDANKKAEF